MKRIGIDCRLYSQTGVGVYIRNLLHHLQKQNYQDLIFYLYVMEEDASHIHLPDRFVKRIVNCKWHSIGEQIFFSHVLEKDNLDLMHFTYFSYPVLYHRKFMATVHDVTPLVFKTGKASTRSSLYYGIKHFFFRRIFKSQLENAQILITPTRTVKEQIISLYGEKYRKKITPIYEGVNYSLTQADENTDLKNTFTAPFFIYVGNFYPHKNVGRLVRAFLNTKKDTKLILIGPNDFFANRLCQIIRSHNQEDRILFYHAPSPSDLVFFYKNARALIHPSLSEGFGLPIVEAAHFNLPIIASNIDIFKELLGDKYVAFDPLQVKDIQEKIQFFLEKSPRWEYGNIMQNYSFGNMTKEIAHLYRKLVYGV